MGTESASLSSYSYPCESAGPDLTWRAHRLPAFVTPEHCCDVAWHELVGAEDVRDLFGLVLGDAVRVELLEDTAAVAECGRGGSI